MIYVLDASAMIAYLRDELGGEVVERALLDTNSQCLAHAINLCEVLYDFHRAKVRRRGGIKAEVIDRTVKKYRQKIG